MKIKESLYTTKKNIDITYNNISNIITSLFAIFLFFVGILIVTNYYNYHSTYCNSLIVVIAIVTAIGIILNFTFDTLSNDSIQVKKINILLNYINTIYFNSNTDYLEFINKLSTRIIDGERFNVKEVSDKIYHIVDINDYDMNLSLDFTTDEECRIVAIFNNKIQTEKFIELLSNINASSVFINGKDYEEKNYILNYAYENRVVIFYKK